MVPYFWFEPHVTLAHGILRFHDHVACTFPSQHVIANLSIVTKRLSWRLRQDPLW